MEKTLGTPECVSGLVLDQRTERLELLPSHSKEALTGLIKSIISDLYGAESQLKVSRSSLHNQEKPI